MITILNENPDKYVVIIGHTSSDGNEDYNLQLSKDRANAVKDYFIEKGIDTDRITTLGIGSAMPIADNATHEGRIANRRVVVSLRSVK